MAQSIAQLLAVCKRRGLVLGALVLSGCATTANDGAGFEALHPSPASRQFIIANDRPFANEVASHNATYASQPGCRK